MKAAVRADKDDWAYALKLGLPALLIALAAVLGPVSLLLSNW